MIKVKKLEPGSRIGIISPSNGLPYKFPGIYEMGLKNLEEIFRFEVVEFPTARMPQDILYRNPRIRAEDINRAFMDDSIDGIICSIGGYESIRILPYLNLDAIINNPKMIMGFSDATTFLAYLNTLGMVTFYGPSVMAGFAQLKSFPDEYLAHIRDILFGDAIYPYSYKPYSEWTNGYMDWNDNNTLGKCTEFFPNAGWRFVQGRSICEGQLWGGCIEVLEFLKSTKYWPTSDFWNDKILFFETSEDKPTPSQVGYMIRNYGMQGVFEKIKGIIFGRPKDYNAEENQELTQIILDIIQVEFKNGSMPVIMDADFGHTDPKIILPMGCRVVLDPIKNSITLIDNPFNK